MTQQVRWVNFSKSLSRNLSVHNFQKTILNGKSLNKIEFKTQTVVNSVIYTNNRLAQPVFNHAVHRQPLSQLLKQLALVKQLLPIRK